MRVAADYGSGQGNDDDAYQGNSSSPSTSSERLSFAPRGLARFKGALPSPLRIPKHFQKGAQGSRRNVCHFHVIRMSALTVEGDTTFRAALS